QESSLQVGPIFLCFRQSDGIVPKEAQSSNRNGPVATGLNFLFRGSCSRARLLYWFGEPDAHVPLDDFIPSRSGNVHDPYGGNNMNRMLVVIFNEASQVFEGCDALKSLDHEDS